MGDMGSLLGLAVDTAGPAHRAAAALPGRILVLPERKGAEENRGGSIRPLGAPFEGKGKSL